MFSLPCVIIILVDQTFTIQNHWKRLQYLWYKFQYICMYMYIHDLRFGTRARKRGVYSLLLHTIPLHLFRECLRYVSPLIMWYAGHLISSSTAKQHSYQGQLHCFCQNTKHITRKKPRGCIYDTRCDNPLGISCLYPRYHVYLVLRNMARFEAKSGQTRTCICSKPSKPCLI